MKKGILTFLLGLGAFLLYQNPLEVFAATNNESLNIVNDLGYNINLEISESVKDQLSESEIMEIANEGKEDTTITIHEVVELPEINEDSFIQERLVIVPNFRIETSKSYTGSNKVLADKFVISVAKGQTTTLSRTFTHSVELSISGSYYSLVDLGLKQTVTATYSTTHQFSGPTTGSYNSREFRVKFYGDTGKYTQKKVRIDNGSVTGTKTGTFTEPKKYAMYSIDKNI